MKRVLVAFALLCCAAAAIVLETGFLSNNKPDTPAVNKTKEAGENVSESPLTLEEIRTVTFTDVSPSSAAADCISYVAHEDILSGIDSDCFRPDDWVPLATVLTALHSISGEPAPVYKDLYTDVAADSWYVDAVSWAYSADIITDSETGRLDALEPVTRARLAALLYSFAAPEGEGAHDERLAAYTDGDAVPNDARLPLAWLLEKGLFSCMVSGTIHPGLPVTRAQLAQVLTALTAYRTEETVAVELANGMIEKIPASVSQISHKRIQQLINKTAAKYGAVGIQAAVVENGRVTDSYTYGWAEEGSEAMTPEHKIRSASLSKVAVGMAAMLLREEGFIDLDRDISAYWGVSIQNLSHPGVPVTVRSLLTHTSTIKDFEGLSTTYSAVRAQLGSPISFTSGTPGEAGSWGYNNYGFAVLGMTLELASGKYLDTVMREHLWNIMEIDASFNGGCIKNTDLLATVYREDGTAGLTASRQKGYTRASAPGQSGAFFAGGLTASAVDLAKMAALLASDGCYEGVRLMQAESVELMEDRTRLPDGTDQALPLRSQDGLYGRSRIYYHTGSAYGVYNLFSYDPDTGDGVVVLTTGARGTKDSRGIYAVCSEISGGIYQLLKAGQ
ncbi:MAG: serine hydrolase [Oscillospiraceae bacterium]|nr:serine hydrolase [Oscillospiraceae bacterium]